MFPELLYGVWESNTTDVPARTPLYSLFPIGLGTPQIESFSGYIARLAEAHVVSVGDLVGRGPWKTARAGPSRRTEFVRRTRPAAHAFHAVTHDINGISPRVRKWVTVFERWTAQQLGALTFWSWRNTLSAMLLFKRRKAWCPICYENDRDETGVYERLLWTIHVVAICPQHGTLLETRCSTCGKTQSVLAVHSRPGYCSVCGGWLGRKDLGTRLQAEPGEYKLYVANSVGELLARAGAAGRLSGARFRTNLQMCVNRLAYGNASAFAEFVRASHSAVQSWLAGTTRPRLDVLVRVCYHLGISAAELLTSRRLNAVDWSAVARAFPAHDRGVKAQRTPAQVRSLLRAALRADDCSSISELSKRLGYRRSERLYQVDADLCRRITVRHRASGRSHWWRRPGATRICEVKGIRSALKQSLTEDPPVSVRRIAAGLGYANAGFLHRKFPALCRTISRRFEVWRRRQTAELRQRVKAACAEMPPPTVGELSRRLGLGSPTVLRSRFPAETERLLKARAMYAESKTAKLRVALVSMMSREPAPSLGSVARQVGLSVSSLVAKVPDLCRAIGSNYVRSRKETTRLRRKLLDEEVLRIARHVHSKGQNPTVARIQDLLGENSLREWRALQRAVRRARQYLGLV